MTMHVIDADKLIEYNNNKVKITRDIHLESPTQSSMGDIEI